MTFCSSFSYFQVDLFYINNGYLITRQFSNQNMTSTWYYDVLLTFVQWFPLYDALLLYSSYSAGVVTYIKYMGIQASVNLIAGPRLHAKTFQVWNSLSLDFLWDDSWEWEAFFSGGLILLPSSLDIEVFWSSCFRIPLFPPCCSSITKVGTPGVFFCHFSNV